jgi:hypothetical protein
MNWMKKCNRKQIFNLTKCNAEMIIIKINFYIVQLLFCKTLGCCSMKQTKTMNNENKKRKRKWPLNLIFKLDIELNEKCSIKSKKGYSIQLNGKMMKDYKSLPLQLFFYNTLEPFRHFASHKLQPISILQTPSQINET